MARKALAVKHSPRGLHLQWYVVVWLLIDRLQPASWVWGVVGTLCAVGFVCGLVDFFSAEDVEL